MPFPLPFFTRTAPSCIHYSTLSITYPTTSLQHLTIFQHTCSHHLHSPFPLNPTPSDKSPQLLDRGSASVCPFHHRRSRHEVPPGVWARPQYLLLSHLPRRLLLMVQKPALDHTLMAALMPAPTRTLIIRIRIGVVAVTLHTPGKNPTHQHTPHFRNPSPNSRNLPVLAAPPRPAAATASNSAATPACRPPPAP